MQFTLQTDLTVLPQSIEFNFDELKADLSEQLELYRGLIVTEDSIPGAKDKRAKLNALVKSVEDARKSVKKTMLEPYNDFEKQIKELVALIQQPIDAIDTQVKAFEDAAKEEKYQSIARFYQTNIGSLMDIVPIERILNPKWANKGMDFMVITQEMITQINKIKNDIEVLRKMRLPGEQQVIDVYLRTFDMSAALAEKNRLEEQAAKLKALEDEQKAALPEPPPVAPMPAPVPPPAENPAKPVEQPTQALKTIDVRFHETTEAFRQEMKALTEKHGIKYAGIPTDDEGRIIPWQQSKTA